MLTKHRVMIVLLSMAVGFLTGCSSVDSTRKSGYDFSALEKTAVVSVTGDLRGARTKNQVATFVQMELMRKGYSVIERQEVQKVLEEQDFQRSDVTQAIDAARAGEVLNVPAVIMADIKVDRDRVDMTMKMVDVESAEVVWIGETTGHSGRTLATVGGALVGVGTGVVAGGSRSGRIVGGVLGGAVGGVAGHTLTAAEADLVKKMVKKIGTVMPSRVGSME